MKQRSTVLFVMILLAVLISACTKAKTVLSDGSLYSDINLGIEIFPAAGWGIFVMNNALIDGVSFYPPDQGNARFFITSKTAITESLAGLRDETDRTKSLADHISKYRAKRKERPRCRILREKKEKLNSIPAHLIETAYMHEGRIPAEDKSYFFEHNHRYYVAGYWVLRDQDYDKNIILLQNMLGALKIVK